MTALLAEIISQRWAVATNIIAVVLFCGFYWFMTRQYSWKKSRMKYFSYLYSLKKNEIVCVAIILGRMIFVFTSAVFCTDIHIGYLIVFILMNIVILIFSKNLKGFGLDCANYIGIFFMLFIEKTLIDYYFEVESTFVIVSMVVMLALFIVLDGVLQAISSYDRVIKWDVE